MSLPNLEEKPKIPVSGFEYDGLDRRSRLYYPQPANIGAYASTDYEEASYDANGNVVSLRRRSGQVVSLGYDNLDRLTSRSYSNAAANVSFSYDLLGRRRAAADGQLDG